MVVKLTPVDSFAGWYTKREDLACFTGLKYPSGSKVRQYMSMAKAQPGSPMLVGCSANSCMQIYVAAAAKQTGVPAIIYLPARKIKTAATDYALSMGAELNEVRPGYLSVVRLRAKERAKQLGNVVRWNITLALKDAVAQCANIPEWVDHVVVSTGSGLIASGVLAGLATRKKPPTVVAVAVSTMADYGKIIALAKRTAGPMTKLPKLELIQPTSSYDEWTIASLPDGTPLDPFYAAKALPYVKTNDCLWTPGLRPVAAMPAECQAAFKDWKPRRSK